MLRIGPDLIRRGTLVLLAVCCGSQGAIPQASRGSFASLRDPNKPNIILIVADDLGYGDLGSYGQQKIQTPNLDRLAREGLRFTQCYAGSSFGAASRACLLTGLHSGHARIRGPGTVPLQPEDLTVAEVLQQAGYKTGAVGVWDLGREQTSGLPTRQGFEDWVGYLDPDQAQDYYPDQLWRNDRLFPLNANRAGRPRVYSPDFFSTVRSNYVRVTRQLPFFLYLAHNLPRANLRLAEKTGNGMEVPSDRPYSSQPWPQPEKNKAAMITRLDREIGALLKQLEDLDLDRHTAIFFTSDNGPHADGGVKPGFFKSAGPCRGHKGSLHEGGLRVPFLVRWPGKVSPGSVSDLPCALWDFLPTAAEIVGQQPPENLDGISILPTLLGQTQTNQHPFLYWESHGDQFQQAIRLGPWKAIRPAPDQPLQLFNLTSDPAEETNLAPEQAELLSQIQTALQQARSESKDWPVPVLSPNLP